MSRKFLSPIKLAQGATNPSTGSSGELFFNTTDLKVYAHNGTTWLPSGGGVTVSATAPTSPVAGDAWYDTNDGTLFVYYVDATANFVGTRTNLITNPSFEVNYTGWTVMGANVQVDSTKFYSGTKSLKLTTIQGNSDTGISMSFATVIGQQYTMSAKIWVPTGQTIYYAMLPPYVALPTTTGVGDWQTINLTITAQATSTTLYIMGGDVPSFVYYIDSVLVEKASSVGTYFDGSTAGAAWTGTANASTSTMITTLAGQWVEVSSSSGISVNLSGRVGVLETYVTTLQSEMDTAQADITAIQTYGYRLAQTLYLTSSTAFTKASYPWLRAIKVKAQAGGGGGGGAGAAPSGQVVCGKSGTGGVYAESFITNIAGLASSVSVTVGTGGSGGSAGNNSGSNGGDSSFGSLVVATGGYAGGTADYTYPPNHPAMAVAGPTSGTGDMVIPGGDAGSATAVSSSWVKIGDGGGSHMSLGTVGPVAVNTVSNGTSGLAGKNYGGGGTGGANTTGISTARSGGAGAPGIVIVELYA